MKHDFKKEIEEHRQHIASEIGQRALLQMIWANEEYEEPEVDWSKVEVDTPILVRDNEQRSWNRRYFAKFENGHVYAWADGCTSWSAKNKNEITTWKYAKLAEDEDGE